jgi:polysaccharide chain length determinant protein (PEP-CTERM system associated)
MLPGKSYSPEDIVRILLRRWWVIGGLLFIGAIGAFVVSHRLIDLYRSETLILVVPQRVPESYVKSTVTGTIEDRLPTISQQILSRSRLERIIVDMNLYAEDRQKMVMEDVVQRMRDRDVRFSPEKGDTSFRVSYVSPDPKTAQKVTERLASLLIEENSRDRENQAEDTNQFLDSQLEDTKRQLLEQEKKLEEYKRAHSGQLPTQVTTNMQAIQNAQIQLQNLAEGMNRTREQKAFVERQLLDLEAPDPVVASTTAPAPSPINPDGTISPDASIDIQLEAARARLRVAESRLKPEHPEVRTLKRTIQDLEAQKAAQPATTAAADPAKADPKPETPQQILKERRARDLRVQIEGYERELQDRLAQEKQLRATINDYQARLEAVPSRESDLVELTRDYDTLNLQYQNLLVKRGESKLAANLERRNIGEQFKVIDPASLPERPFSPNRRMIYLGGIGGGLALALLLTAFVEITDSSFKNESEVARLLELPVLALVPVIQSPGEKRSQRRRVILQGVAAAVVVMGTAAAFFYWRPSL